MSMTVGIEILPNDLGPTVDFYTGVLAASRSVDACSADPTVLLRGRGRLWPPQPGPGRSPLQQSAADAGGSTGE
ncbi:MAG TPA: hypothetical protein VIT42_04425 [Microlunatus sp.]